MCNDITFFHLAPPYDILRKVLEESETVRKYTQGQLTSDEEDEFDGVFMGGVYIGRLNMDTLLFAQETVLDRPTIRVQYRYPLKNSGPSDLEQMLKGWIFEEVAPNGKSFTRGDVYQVISKRYRQIYDDEDKYDIFGHSIDDLVLDEVHYDQKNDVWKLGISS